MREKEEKELIFLGNVSIIHFLLKYYYRKLLWEEFFFLTFFYKEEIKYWIPEEYLRRDNTYKK